MSPAAPFRAMEIRIERSLHLSTATLGSLFVDGLRECYTREPAVRGDRLFVAGETALPVGWYNLSLASSRRYGLVVPLLAGSPLRSEGGLNVSVGMRILPGRHVHDVDVGILVGTTLADDTDPRDVRHTREAYLALLAKLEAARLQNRAIDVRIC